MGRAGAAAHDHDEVARVVALFDGDAANAADHVRVDDREDAVRGLFHVELERPRHVRGNGVAGRRGVDPQPAAEQRFVVQIAQHDQRVGDGRPPAAAAVGRGPRLRARAFRADLQQSQRVDECDAAPAGAQRLHLEHGNPDSVAQEIEVLEHVRLAVLAEADVETRAAHVHGNHVPRAHTFGEERPGVRPGRGSRIERVNTLIGQKRPGRQAAVALHVTHLPGIAEVAEEAFHAFDVAPDDRADVGVDDGRTGARVLADLRQQIDRQRDVRLRHCGAYHLGNPPLMVRVQKRPQQRDGDRLDPFVLEQADAAAHVILAEWRAHLARTQHPPADRNPQRARHEHGRLRKIRIVAVPVFLVAEPDFERILVARGTEQAGLGALVLDQRIHADGRAQNHQVAPLQKRGYVAAEVRGDLLDPVVHGRGRIMRSGGRLVEPNPLPRGTQNEVGERPAGVDTEAVGSAGIGSVA